MGGGGCRGEDRLRRRDHWSRRLQEDRLHQGRPRAHVPRPEGREGRCDHRSAFHHPRSPAQVHLRRRREEPRGGRRQGGAQVSRLAPPPPPPPPGVEGGGGPGKKKKKKKKKVLALIPLL